ncbi:MAG TPA: putative glycolipid-binding domain-containing protein [Dongiaceae bacterium]|jgi:hypothetical protein
MDDKPGSMLHRVVWRRTLDDKSIEYCTVASRPGGVSIFGHIVTAHESQPLEVAYDIRCGADWAAQALNIEQACDGSTRRLRMARAESGWLIDGAPDPRLAGCAEPDIGLTPSTNALAIRRLGLAVGGAGDITAAWVKLPALTVEPSRQRYERLGPHDYRYTNLDSGFTAILTVDALALPVTYEGVWTRIADWHGDTS